MMFCLVLCFLDSCAEAVHELLFVRWDSLSIPWAPSNMKSRSEGQTCTSENATKKITSAQHRDATGNVKACMALANHKRLKRTPKKFEVPVSGE